MPSFMLTTNVAVADSAKFNAKASKLMAQITGKPEKFVCVSVRADTPMSFGGSADPCGYVVLVNLGGFKDNKAICGHVFTLLERELGLAKDRVYVEINAPNGADYGWNGSTFA
ncbi:Macrophage migration inhibitory factor-like [Porphyridium purpureum]|uniref:L-dopachrome isomerase n=1 Tax=Porphyridium purpureum TaxID=35688 RepID=A0A5J4YS32_PORPP|nr:Macrophage migration inhibitory factor-like [Porphyridium purpureum]|eukprot:POR5179..scf229_5